MIQNKIKGYLAAGVTLLEMMLVTVIISSTLLLLIKYSARQVNRQINDKTAVQMQQILNAAAAYYNAYGAWPTTCDIAVGTSGAVTSGTFSNVSTSGLVTNGYLPINVAFNSYAYQYQIDCSDTLGVFYVIAQVPRNSVAKIIAGILPVAYVSNASGVPDTAGTGTYVTAQITVPGANLNNANAINFAGVYQHGSCVPVPYCPGYDTTTFACLSGSSNCLTPKIIVGPTSVAGLTSYDSTYNNFNAYPLVGFYAYAVGPSSSPGPCNDVYYPSGSTTPSSCIGTTNCPATATCSGSRSGAYWRVCSQVNTEYGQVSANVAQYQYVMAMTRCGL